MSGVSFGFPGRNVGPDRQQLYQTSLRAIGSGEEEKALAQLDQAPLSAWNDARLWQVKALLARQIGHLDTALVDFAKAFSLLPDDALIAHGLARTRLEAGLPAVEAFRHACAMAPGDNGVLLGLVAALAADEGNDAAAAELRDLLHRNPRWHGGHDALCRLRWQSGERDCFADMLEQTLQLYPSDLDLWRLLLIILSQGDLNQRLLETVQRGRAAAGDHLLFTANEAVARAELGDVAEADRLFEQLKLIEDPTLRVRHTRHLLRNGRVSEAAELAFAQAQGPAGLLFWPYVSLAWRLLGDSRSEWLEGDERLVGVYDLRDRLPSLEALAGRLRSLHTSIAQPLEQSVRGGTQTEGPLLSRLEPEIRALRQAVIDQVREHIAQLPPMDPAHPTLRHRRDAPVRIAGSWSVRLTGSGYHANHIHPQGWFSSALYIALPGEAERGPAPAGWFSLGVPQKELGVDLPPTREIEPKPGRLILFPSTMWHGTHPFGAGERLTCAFDVAPPR